MSLQESRKISKLLVANRGEIAVRIMRACRELGIATVAVYGEGEESALHVQYADDAYRLTTTSGIAYLDIEAIIAIARRAGADAVHPGYGFLSEKAAFATAVNEAGLIFVGPSAENIASMGDKVEARRIAIDADVHPVPGTTDPVASAAEAANWAREYGYPVAVKASGGGGGRGFRVARDESEIESAFEGSRGEAERYFANPTVYLERYLEHPRHIEVQVFGDAHGNVVAFPERDCSIQRRHQKLVEESPSPAVTPAIRQSLLAATEQLAGSVGYVGAGTVEFLLDEDGSFYFLEMNTRIQVEHTITEMVTGIDLVAEQIRVAEGQPLSFARDITSRGWAIECRINAEDSSRGFAPAPGTITSYREPAGFGVRVDSGFVGGGTIQPSYDSLISKLVVWGEDRDQAIRRMKRALLDYEIAGVPTTIDFHSAVLAHAAFVDGEATTTFLQDYPEILDVPARASTVDGLASESADVGTTTSDLIVEVAGRRFAVTVTSPANGVDASTPVAKRSRTQKPRRGPAGSSSANGDELTTAVQGTVVRIGTALGTPVVKGDLIAVIEAMKMENEITAHKDGVISTLDIAVGDSVASGARLATISQAE